MNLLVSFSCDLRKEFALPYVSSIRDNKTKLASANAWWLMEEKLDEGLAGVCSQAQQCGYSSQGQLSLLLSCP